MAERLVAADASPLIALAAAEAFELLHDLFGTVMVTRAVRDEVKAGGDLPGARELDAAMQDGWIRVARTPMETWAFPELGVGEASTLALALQHGGDALVLMDDALGREQARARGVPVMDLAGLLLAAKRARLVELVAPIFTRLARCGFTVPDAAVRGVLEEAGEA